MAKTFTLTSTSYDGRYMQLVCTQTPNGSTANSSTISWTLTTAGGNSNYYTTGATTVNINGTTVYSKSRVDWSSKTFPASKGSVSGTTTVSHNNNGDKSIAVSFSTAIYTSTLSTYSGTWTLDSIPRYGTSNQSLNSKTETTITMNWSSDSTVDYLWYSTDWGANWVAVGSVNAKNGTYTITKNTHTGGSLSPSSTYNIITRIRRKDSQLTTDSSKLSVDTYDYPYCTSSPDFVIGNAVTLSFYNPLNRTITVKLIGNGDAVIGGWTGSGTSTSGFNDTDTANSQYGSIPNTTSSKYKVQVTYGSVTKTRDNGNTYSVDQTKCIPTFSNFTYKDTNTTVTGVTGNDQVLVKGLSSLQVTISSANKMVAKNGASGNKYIATIDTLNESVNYSTNDINLAVGTVANHGTKRLTVTAYDSRNISKAVYKDITVYDYAKPVINASIKRLNNFEDQTTITVAGTYTRLTIDGTDKNTITSVQYRYREAGGTWGSWSTLTTTLTSGKFTCSDVILSLDNTKSFEFEIQAVDKLQTNTAEATLDIGKAIFFISTNKRACYINGEPINLGYREPAILVNGDYNIMCSLDSGFYKSTSVTNAPYTQPGQDATSNWFFVTHIAHSENYQMQIASPFFEDGLYYRHSLNGTWGDWRTIQEEGIVLYNNSSGTSGTVTLSETTENFEYIEIFFGSLDGGYGDNSLRLYNPNGRTACLQVSIYTANQHFSLLNHMLVSGTTISVKTSYRFEVPISGTAPACFTYTGQMKIARVVGYR